MLAYYFPNWTLVPSFVLVCFFFFSSSSSLGPVVVVVFLWWRWRGFLFVLFAIVVTGILTLTVVLCGHVGGRCSSVAAFGWCFDQHTWALYYAYGLLWITWSFWLCLLNSLHSFGIYAVAAVFLFVCLFFLFCCVTGECSFWHQDTFLVHFSHGNKVVLIDWLIQKYEGKGFTKKKKKSELKRALVSHQNGPSLDVPMYFSCNQQEISPAISFEFKQDLPLSSIQQGTYRYKYRAETRIGICGLYTPYLMTQFD